MAKIAIIGDMHLGARNSNQVIQRFQNEFFDNTLFPYLKDNGIKTVIQLGDLIDNRKWLNVQTLYNIKAKIIKPMQELDVQFHTFLGNHDIPLRSTLKYSSPEFIFGEQKNFTIHKKPTTIEINDFKIALLPWICKDNKDEAMEFINNPSAELLLGHLEVNNAVMMPGAHCQGGLDVNIFNKWKEVMSGHFHTPNKIQNVNYIGTPYQLTWSDYNSKRGFWIYDTDAKQLETFVENPYVIFNKVYYNDNMDLDKVDLSHLEGTYVKLQVEEKKDYEKFEKFLTMVNLTNPFELKIIESFEEYNADNVADTTSITDTKSLLSEYVDEVQTNSMDKDAIKNLIGSIFQEAKDLENNG